MAKLSKEGYLEHLFNIRKKLKDFTEKLYEGDLNYFQDIALKLRILFMKKEPLLEVISNLYDFELKVFVQHTTKDRVQKGTLSEELAKSTLWCHTNSSAGWFNFGQKTLNILDAIKQENTIEINGNYFSYKKVIETVADKMGGAHIDENIQDKDLLPHNENILFNGWTMAQVAIHDTAISTIKAIDIIEDFILTGEEDFFIKFKSKTTYPSINEIEEFQTNICNLTNNFKPRNTDEILCYLKNNLKIFRLFDYERVLFKPKLNISSIENWAMGQSKDGNWNIIVFIDIETEQLSEGIEMGLKLSQEVNSVEVRREFLSTYKREILSNIKPVFIFIGNSFDDSTKIYELLNKYGSGIDFLCFENFINKINSLLFTFKNYPSENEALATAVLFKIFKIENENNFLFDYGISSNQNRLTLFVDKSDNLSLRLIDNECNEYIVQEKFNNTFLRYEHILFIYFELIFTENYLCLVLDINSKVFRFKRIPVNKLDLSAFFGVDKKSVHLVIGSDCFGKEPTNIIISHTIAFTKGLTPGAIYKTRQNMISNSKNGLKAIGNQYIVINKDNHPNFK